MAMRGTLGSFDGLVPVAGSSTLFVGGSDVSVVVDVVATVVVVEVGASDDATVVVVTSGAVVIVVGAVVVGAVVVVGATVVVVVVVVVVGTACHWAYRVKSAVWLCASPAVISLPPEAAVYQPLNV